MADDQENGVLRVLRSRRPVYGPPQAMPPLREAPEEAPKPEEPSFIGRALGYSPRASLGSQVSRWYENAGGLDKAIDSAQQAQSRRNDSVLDGLTWPKWKPGDVTDRKAPIKAKTGLDMDVIVTHADGLYWPSNGAVWLRDGIQNRQSVLEHELSHGAFLRDESTADAMERAAKNNPSWVVPHGGNESSDRASYLLDPAETDVRLAEIKRHYAHHTGKLVTNPDEAKEAWSWWRSYNRNFRPDSKPLQPGRRAQPTPIERPEDTPTLFPSQFEFYDNLPDTMKKQMFHRMPELVRSSPDRIRELQRQS